ncbi:hypothetical protein DL770_001325 [Monosporascus sp. CRB-9-2]|nr:hypothetical protein DL770_001325 [Monosporascus sp. CRB-9-2]
MYTGIRSRLLPAALAALSLLTQSVVESKMVFAHYMVGTVDPNTDHVKIDVDQAMNVGFDAFALNVGRPSEPWAISTVEQLFNYANGKNFKLFFSFDFYQEGDINAHKQLWQRFRDHPAHLRYDDKPVVSSYAGGWLSPDVWADFRRQNNVYLIPNVEQDGGYYSNPPNFFNVFRDAVDGVFTWETSWPPASDSPLNVSSYDDERIKAAADAAGKTYVMGLSPLQYKHCCGNTWYRAGETNMPERMAQILRVSPEFTEFITWNDAGESHYIANCWAEGLPEDILEYGNSDTNPHDGWQPLVASFIDAFKSGTRDAGAMRPRGNSFAGAMWYRSVTKACGGDVPRGAGAAVGAVNYAVVLPAGSSGMRVRVISGGRVLAEQPVGPGLNYNSVAGMGLGAQKIELLNAGGAVIATANSNLDVTDRPNQYGFCDYNYRVAGLR